MTVTSKIEQELIRDPGIRNFALVAKYQCSNALISRIRKRLGVPYYANMKQHFSVYVPAYMLNPLAEIAADMGDTVTIDDLVVGVLNDLIAEHRDCEAAE